MESNKTVTKIILDSADTNKQRKTVKRYQRPFLTCETMALGLFLVSIFLTSCNCQSAAQSSQTITEGRHSEGFFINGSSYAVISETLSLQRGSHIGFSFKTCKTGELLRQTDGSESLDEIRMYLSSTGSLVLAITVGDQRHEESVGIGLNDGLWHTVVLRVLEETEDITISVNHGQDSSTATLTHTDLVRSLDLRATNPQLRVSAGLVACIREGPGVRFSKPSAPVTSFGVIWDQCFLPDTCSGFDWSQVTNPRASGCESPVCQNNGVCLPHLTDPDEETASPFCLCPPGFTGPTCAVVATTCEEDPCKNGATCTEDPSGGTGYECQCTSSYQGRHCETETPRCVQNSCQNGGTCLSQPTGFLCECPSQFAGLRCERAARAQTINPCLSENPCRNGGTCTFSSASGSYTCTCDSGFSGKNCEIDLCSTRNCPLNSICVSGTDCQCLPGYQELTIGDTVTCEDIDECQSSPCYNGGTCLNLINGFRCQCPNGFTGSTCDEIIDYCALNNRCQNGGVCRNLPESASITCVCPDGFTGVYCEEDINECEEVPSPCLNNAQCQNFKGGYSCQCEPGWTGAHCEENMNECASAPCKNNATCKDLVNAFECVCQPGFEGIDCSINTDECASEPCLNGGSCVDQVNNFTCSCTPQFMGPRCERPYDPCVVHTCQNGGQCIATKTERDPGNDFHCECPQGFIGPRCEHNINECEGITCPDNKICVDLIASYECRCPQGFTGDNCSIEIDDCVSSPCQNGGTCIDKIDGFECTCPSGWAGVTCSEDINECSLNPTICNNGICKNVEGSYECYCRPGFSGSNCNHDFDECLSRPCQNNGSCTNLVNSYECTCAPGFKGSNCEINIDECASNPCENNATCLDGINNFTCSCLPGFTGRLCETNINECEPSPCLNNGSCIDGINSFVCLCDGTGFTGSNCEINIDECLNNPCQNNATCVDGINDYTCECFPGYGGKNCDQDIAECLEQPCLNNALCFELSNLTLYQSDNVAKLPDDVRQFFEAGFSYFNASGYVCSCISGFAGVNCEINIDDCASDPCVHGTCTDGINQFFCECDPGYHGTRCEIEIDECETYNPCVNGLCIDRIADYDCQCNPNFGGKNCSVVLTGCDTVSCLNGGTCTPWLIGEDDHKANCTCVEGFEGLRCQSRTTFSLTGSSYIKIPSDRLEGYELHMKFRTTIGNGLVAIGQGNTLFSLRLRNGRLNLHSNLISKYEGIIIGENLNNTKWQKVYVAVNTSHLTLGVNDQLQATQPINPAGENDTVFFNTFIGGINKDQAILAREAPSFIGCVQDIVVNEMKITEEDFKTEERGIEQVNTEPGCPRKDQCHPNPCQNEGVCTDLWSTYQCTCHRPFLGPSCQHNYTAATFGYENITNSLAYVDINEPGFFRSGVDISMFIRTREESGFIFYFGSDTHVAQESYITGQLVKGNLVVNVTFDGKTERFQVYTVNLSNGYRHFIRVVRMNNSMMVKVNETVSISHEIPSPTAFIAEKLFLGNFPTNDIADMFAPTPTRTQRLPVTTASTTTSTFASTSTSAVLTTTPAGEDETTVVDFEQEEDQVTEAPVQVSDDQAPTLTPVQASAESDTNIRTNDIFATSVEHSSSTQDVEEAITASSVVVYRSRRESPQSEFGFTDLHDFKPPHFKGVIQDIRISDGGNVTRIVELFKLDYDDVIKPPSIGDVHLFNVKPGVVSDNTCSPDPCRNGGICHVTWNDYRCECPKGYKGRNCTQKEYCYWYTCPHDSECVSLIDGHECISNATFNGYNASVTLRSNQGSSVVDSTITAKFRTKRNGTLLHIRGIGNQFIRISVRGPNIVVEVPEKDSISFTNVGDRANNGVWHTILIRFVGRVLSAVMDNYTEKSISLDPLLNLSSLVASSEVIVGASHSDAADVRAQYQFAPDTEDQPVTTAVDIRTDDFYTDYFRGCIGEVRVGGILLPFFSDVELVNTTASNRFILESRHDVTMDGCVLCYEQECQNGGSCLNPAEVFECECPKGFEDEICSTNIDECLAHECINGACIDGVANYTCTCIPGWTGWLCNEDLDECLSHPCQNGGSCQETEEIGDYVCTCTSEYEGRNCQELKIKTCNEHPCQNGGTCRDGLDPVTGELYTCDCTTAYKGVNCEIKKNFCEEFQFPCQNGASCVSIDSTYYYKCLCPPGYTGENCESEIDECSPNPCKNKGRCTDLLDAFVCDCTGTGFEGLICEININECISSPCIQGNCTDTPGSYFCDCLQGYCGKNCQREDPCQLTDGLCKNEGFCRPSCDEPPFYTCDCTPEWEGQNCSIKSARAGNIALIVGPIVGGILFIAVIAVLVFIVLARRKRKSEGKYKPATQELTSPRLQLDNIIKPPPEERLI